ncbi:MULTISPECIES: TIGR04282 family arsenosugar biosynthesis glycosyltransferase [Flavobacterium]|uniref:TIGR04282 family arsenosugar biosynthesis glycosyltransferase n=1 Tax=Flavobacterium jumunjinense TaxID=998845 RepID=A0ABV5GU64_9FLAO|nr:MULTISPECIES: TIGR04282 family arsenosugar biosynthesis glycosyltransferase [Flavobacterium]
MNQNKPVNSKKALIIFTRNPELGKCKTRLAKTIGDEAALEVYTFLLQHTANVGKDVMADRFVFYSENIIENDIWQPEYFNKKLQSGYDLGNRMQNAFEELFQQGYQKIIIIGSDLYDLNATIVNEAYNYLSNHDFVIGPAEDGGYYLLGMTQMEKAVFANKEWGTATVLKDTLQDLPNKNIKLIQELNDIDIFEDIENIEEFKKYKPIE